MNPEVSCLVDFRLVPVAPGAYPFWEDQVWAEPDLEGAIDWMIRLVDDPCLGTSSRTAREHPHPLATSAIARWDCSTWNGCAGYSVDRDTSPQFALLTSPLETQDGDRRGR